MISGQFPMTAFVVVVAPGSAVLYTLGQGRRAAMAAAIGCTIGIMPHLAAAIFGLAAILHTSAVLFTVVKFAGVAYLLSLAWSALSEGGALQVEPDGTSNADWRVARRGALINILNPKLSVFFLALLPLFLSGNPATAVAEMVLLGGVFMGMIFAALAGRLALERA